jgi:hypothetical protein
LTVGERFTKEDISSSDEDKFSYIETERVLFMEVEESDKENSEEEYEEAKEAYEDVEEELKRQKLTTERN